MTPALVARPLCFALSVLSALLALAAEGPAPPSSGTASVQILAINDFHGNLEPPAGPNGRVDATPAGGAEFLATHLQQAIAEQPSSIVVAAGDLVGASPLASALFHDEPTIDAMNAMHLAVASVGNHEFDHGSSELLRLQNGGCHPIDGCRGADAFGGARFQYLAANVISAATHAPLLPATAIRRVGGVKIGFIGETLKGTKSIVSAAGVRGLTFLDEASTANRYAAALGRQGVHAIVLLVHEGGQQGDADGTRDPNGCVSFSGAIAPIARALVPDIKVVVSGHTHQLYNCTIAGHLVTSAGSFGRAITRVNLTIDRATDRITHASAVNELVTRDVARDPTQAAIAAKYSALSAGLANRVVGSITADITRTRNAAGESSLGDVIADAQLDASKGPDKGGAVVAFMNVGGIRADIVAAPGSGGAGPAPVTYDALYTAQPFGNTVTVVTLTGAMLRRLLEQQFDNRDPGPQNLLQVSRGFEYRYRWHAPAGQHVDPASITIGGRLVRPTDRVRVAASDFLLAGGEGLTVLRAGVDKTVGDVDIEALVAYFAKHSPVAPGPRNRIVRID